MLAVWLLAGTAVKVCAVAPYDGIVRWGPCNGPVGNPFSATMTTVPAHPLTGTTTGESPPGTTGTSTLATDVLGAGGALPIAVVGVTE